ncbi:MAG: hypothetical protein DWQ06_12110 [Calditrichaeota bacterium]|nr:MAG: hypothetical protein DWQ06_12110 [Calditrichota bacterium]
MTEFESKKLQLFFGVTKQITSKNHGCKVTKFFYCLRGKFKFLIKRFFTLSKIIFLKEVATLIS